MLAHDGVRGGRQQGLGHLTIDFRAMGVAGTRVPHGRRFDREIALHQVARRVNEVIPWTRDRVRDAAERFAVVVAHALARRVHDPTERMRPRHPFGDARPDEIRVMVRIDRVVVVEERHVVRVHEPREGAVHAVAVPPARPDVSREHDADDGVLPPEFGQDSLDGLAVLFAVRDDPVLDVRERGPLDAGDAFAKKFPADRRRDHRDLWEFQEFAVVIDQGKHRARTVDLVEFPGSAGRGRERARRIFGPVLRHVPGERDARVLGG